MSDVVFLFYLLVLCGYREDSVVNPDRILCYILRLWISFISFDMLVHDSGFDRNTASVDILYRFIVQGLIF